MVQKPLVGSVGPTTNGLNMNQTNQQQQQQTQYSPQISNHQTYYQQQQLIKSNQPQSSAGQTQAQAATAVAVAQFMAPQNRVNGLQQVSNQQQYSSQQNSPQNQSQTPLDSLYNGNSVSRAAPIYAPKPTYYSQQQQSVYQTTPLRPMQQAPFYQQQQQQHSPANLTRGMHNLTSPMMQQTSGLSVRQLPNGLVNQLNLSPLQSNEQRNQQQQQQQQMQQVFMSYQQMNPVNQNELIQQQSGALLASNQLVQERQVDARWPNQSADQQSERNESMRQQRAQFRSRSQLAIVSDRDSVSTLSRANQFDERRSFTMRSQYTNHANQKAKYSQKFTFLKLTVEALRRIVGLGNDQATIVNTNHLQHNLSLTLSSGQNQGNNSSKNLHQTPFCSQQNAPTNPNGPKVTASIDSGENLYFRRKVFRYQLVMMRLISLLSATFVLLSPVVMLLLPKLETVFRQTSDNQLVESSSTSSLTSAEVGVRQTSITHAVGLNKQQAANNQQQAYFAPQAQWKISECSSDCDGPLIGFVARFIMLCVAYWAIFVRAQTTTLPRIDFHRCLLTSAALLLTLAYWLFFVFRIFDKRFNDFELQYSTIVQFSLSLLESLILLHYLAVVLLELRNRKKIYCLKVVRSPDGVSQYYSCGSLSIQKCAQFVLEKYQRNFKHFGPHVEQLLSLEDQLAEIVSSQTGRASSPRALNDDSAANRSSRRSVSRSSRHRSRNGAATSEHRRRSSSNSPASRSTRRKSVERGSQVKLYQLDPKPPNEQQLDQTTTSAQQFKGSTSNQDHASALATSNKQSELNSANVKQENDSADQSSDATSRMKESSLETIKAANSTSDLLSQQQKTSGAFKSSSSNNSKKNQRDDLQQQQVQLSSSNRDETESVRSVRSRRSTGRSHHRHKEHRERESRRSHRSSSRLDVNQFGANDGDEDEEVEEFVSNSRSHRSQTEHHSIQMDSNPLEEHERKLRRRKLRLLASVQDSFTQIKLIDEAVSHNNRSPLNVESGTTLGTGQQQQQQTKQLMGPNQAARSLYPNIARTLQKYLRLSKQTGRHNLQSIYEHLSKCLLYKLSARTFLEKFVNQDPVWQQHETNLFADCRLADSLLMCPSQKSKFELNSWSLVCDTLLSRQIRSGTFFVLRQGQVSLLVTIAKMPHLNLSEEVIDQKSCKFLLGPNSETSV